MRVRLPDEIFLISCISAYVIFGSFLIRDSTLETFSGETVFAIRPQQSSSSNVLAPNMNYLNQLKTVTLDGDYLQNSVLNFESTLEKIFLAVVIIHHRYKIILQKVNTAIKSFHKRSTLLAENPSPLPDILSHGMEMVVRNHLKFVVTSYTKSVYDVM